MDFNVGEGVANLMQQLGDYAVRDSSFMHPISKPNITTEFGYGMRYDYRASNASGEWEVLAYPLVIATVPSYNIIQKPVNNHFNGREGLLPVAIVIHTMGGTLSATDSWFANPNSQVSAHFGIGLDGTIHQYVQLSDGAWANGILEPDNKWPFVDGRNPNLRTISIETEDLNDPNQVVTPLQYAATLSVCTSVLHQYPSVRYLMTHRAISPHSKPSCPGPRWTTSRMKDLADALNLSLVI